MTFDGPITLPPKWAEELLRAVLSEKDRETVTGDPLEEYRESIVPSLGGAPIATDFNKWLIDDLFGGVFFHLLLGTLIAAALGLLAATLVMGCLRLSGSGRHFLAK